MRQMRIDYCNAIYAGAPKTITDKLQRVLNAAARVVSDTKKFDRGLSRLHDKLHWLDVPERVNFKLGLMTYRGLHGQAPRYLAEHITPAIGVASRHRLLQTDPGSLYLAVDSTLTAIGLFQLLVRRSGTHCQINSENWRVFQTILQNNPV